VVTCGPWCQGPSLIEMLLLVEQLGIDGLDSMLNDMDGNARPFGKSVGFEDVDMDVDMRTSIGTPTPKLVGRLRSVRGTPGAGVGAGASAFRPGQSKVRLFS